MDEFEYLDVEENGPSLEDWPDPETEMSESDIAWLRRYLFQGSVNVEFQKLNGETRLLFCTWNPKLIPSVDMPDPDRQLPRRQANPNVINAYDLENGGWRAFRLDRVNWFEQVEVYDE